MKTVLCIPAGRQRFLRCLIPYVLRERDVFDECRLWVNTWETEEDAAYVHSLSQLAPDFLKVVDDGGSQVTGRFNHYGRYFVDCHDPDTMYVKCDDDIVWVRPGGFAELVAARLRYRDPLIVCGNIINNTRCNTLHDKLVQYSEYHGWNGLTADPHCRVGHHDPGFSTFALELLLTAIPKDHIGLYYDFGGHWVNDFKHAPNHVYAWFGPDTAWSMDDEKYITTELAKSVNRPIYYHGPAVFAHYAHGPQHKGMPPELLQKFQDLADEVPRG